MADLKDPDEKIVIDEAKAARHVKNIRKMVKDIESLRDRLDPRLLDSNLMRGSVRDAVEEILVDIRKTMDTLAEKGSSIADNIESTVEKYRNIDIEFANKTK